MVVVPPPGQPRRFNDSKHFAAIYDKVHLQYLGEVELPGAVLGSTKVGYLIILSNEDLMEIQFVDIQPIEKHSKPSSQKINVL